MEFKFKEQRNLAVFTTKQVLDGEPILYVYHNLDGYWQFHNSREPNMDEAKLILLEEAVELDHTINEISDLKAGWCAWRKRIGDKWQLAKNENEE